MIRDSEVHYASLEDLIIHKFIASRARDLEDVKEHPKNPAADLPYIRKWLAEFRLVTGEPYAERLDQILRDINCKL